MMLDNERGGSTVRDRPRVGVITREFDSDSVGVADIRRLIDSRIDSTSAIGRYTLGPMISDGGGCGGCSGGGDCGDSGDCGDCVSVDRRRSYVARQTDGKLVCFDDR
jgi:hypothetical protein